MGTYSLYGVEEGLEVRELEGNCTGEQVMSYLDTLALECDPACITVVVLDNAPFHNKSFQGCEEGRVRQHGVVVSNGF